jgi:hypothetical protein
VFFFAVTMGVNHGKGKKDQDADQENDHHWIMCPYPSQHSQRILFHHPMLRNNHASKASYARIVTRLGKPVKVCGISLNQRAGKSRTGFHRKVIFPPPGHL